ncbi:MAG: alpha/beta fold hydrolase [Acidimicrobiia bacterium]
MGRYVSTRLGPIHEVDFGGSGPSIVLIHGLGGSTTNWNAVAPALAEHGRVRAIDLPGFGLTPPRADFKVETHRQAATAYLEALDAPWHTVVGNSTGALLGEMIAATRPELIDRLVLVSPATPPVFPDPLLDWPTVIRLMVQATPILGELYGRRFLRSNTPQEAVRKSLAMVTHKPGRVPLSLVEDSIAMAAVRKGLPWAEHATARTATSIAAVYARRSACAAMARRISAPTLVVQGVADQIVSPTAVGWLCSLRPDWAHVQLEDTGHTPHMDAPLRFVEALDAWLTIRETEPAVV